MRRIAILLVLMAAACGPRKERFVTPQGFPQPVYAFDRNPLTREGIALGRHLFYDKTLSKDGTISCASCHVQSAGFAQPGQPVSVGIFHRKGNRNVPALQNLAWSTSFFLDGGVYDLDLVPIAPIRESAEMDENLKNILAKLRRQEDYPLLFQQAYGTVEITGERFLKALSQFMLTLVSADSRYDRKELSVEEKAGEKLFRQHCSTCHSGPLFTDGSFRNIGLPEGEDPGRYRISEVEKDRNAFRVPSLRNVAVTAPYMHDGRFATLEEVVGFYAGGGGQGAGGRQKINMSEREQRQVVAFLRALTDHAFLRNPRFAPPR